MAVSTTVTPAIWSLPRGDARFPLGMWLGRVTSTGDVSGGNNIASIEWSVTGAPESFSCEEVSLENTAALAADTSFLVSLATRMVVSGTSELVLKRNFIVKNLMAVPEYSNKFSEIIFSPRGSNPWGCSLTKTNVNGESIVFQAWGYIWDVGAWQLPGGPIRPGQFLP